MHDNLAKKAKGTPKRHCIIENKNVKTAKQQQKYRTNNNIDEIYVKIILALDCNI